MTQSKMSTVVLKFLGHLLERCTGDMICALAMLGRTPRDRAAARYVAKIDLHLERLGGQPL